MIVGGSFDDRERVQEQGSSIVKGDRGNCVCDESADAVVEGGRVSGM